MKGIGKKFLVAVTILPLAFASFFPAERLNAEGRGLLNPPARVNDVPNPLGYKHSPSIITLDNGEMNAVWTDTRDQEGSRGDIYFAKSLDNGLSWGDNVLINAYPSEPGYDPDIARCGDNIVVAWNLGNIVTSYSTDGGATWSQPYGVYNGGRPSLAVDQNSCTFYLIMEWTGLHFTKSTDGGQNWLEVQDISEYPMADYNGESSISVDRAGNIHVASVDRRNGSNDRDIFYIGSRNGGQTWSAPLQVNQDTGPSYPYKPYIWAEDISGGSSIKALIVWSASNDYASPGDGDILFSKFNGKVWSPATKVNIAGELSYEDSPSLTVSNARIAVAWVNDKLGDRELHVAHSTNVGNTWVNEHTLAGTSALFESPTVTESYRGWTVIYSNNPDVYTVTEVF